MAELGLLSSNLLPYIMQLLILINKPVYAHDLTPHWAFICSEEMIDTWEMSEIISVASQQPQLSYCSANVKDTTIFTSWLDAYLFS